MHKEFPYLSVNLETIETNSFSLSTNDSAYLYGWGLFETILIHKNTPIHLDEHLNRLKKSAQKLVIPLPFKTNAIKKEIQTLIQTNYQKTKNHLEQAVLNLYLSAGPTSQKQKSFLASAPTLTIKLRPLKTDPNAVLSLTFKKATFTRNLLNSHKTMAYLPNILEKNQCPNVDEVILHNSKKEILEGTKTNIFFIKNKEIFTPKSNVILPGIARNFLLKNQNLFGYKITEKRILLKDIESYDEIFLTNSVRGIVLAKNSEHNSCLQSKDISLTIKAKYTKLVLK
jgi:branched-subunit amino acid aminotransferase/4-amino-4-deoxychorismate lyase